MTLSARDLSAKLSKACVRSISATLVRCVPQIDFMQHIPPVYLFASGQRNRCNPKGVSCIYFSEDEATANAEYNAQWIGTEAEDQPKLTFRANVRLSRVLDLEAEDIRRLLALTDSDLFGSWRRSKGDLPLQSIGRAVDRQSKISAIRFPSKAARDAGSPGWNFAIFKRAVHPPDRVEILGNTGAPIEVWPASVSRPKTAT